MYYLRKRHKPGFTLIELLVVMAILAVLTGFSFGYFRNGLVTSRDGKRKSDVEQVQRALEMYYNDNGVYPVAASGTINSHNWGETFTEIINGNEVVYMNILPTDPAGDVQYCYDRDIADASKYSVYARLENTNDPLCIGGNCNSYVACSLLGPTQYNYVRKSPNQL